MLAIMLLLSGCGTSAEKPEEKLRPWIFLVGERHGKSAYIEEEFEQWRYYYEEFGFRHMMVEQGYCSAQVLNLWMAAEDDEILEIWFANVEGTLSHVPETLEFYRKIKEFCPETVFHGTDVEHQCTTTGQWYMNYLEEQGLGDTEEYQLAHEMMEQARTYYEKRQDIEFREQCMVDNFIREYESLGREPVWGVYGSAHVDGRISWPSEDVLYMTYQLRERYGDLIVCWDILDLTQFGNRAVQTIEIHGKEYIARQISRVEAAKKGLEEQYREYWRLEDPAAFASWKTGEEYLKLAQCNVMRLGDVIFCQVGKSDGTVEEAVYRCDGEIVDGTLVARRLEK